jgi:hypothetical protein
MPPSFYRNPVIPASNSVIPAYNPVIPATNTVIPAKAGISNQHRHTINLA